MLKCQVQPLEFSADEVPPFVVSFPGGNSSNLATKAPDVSFISQYAEKDGRCRRTLAGESQHVAYTGNNYEQDSGSSLQSVFLGVFDPESSTLEISAPTRVINLRPALKGYQSEKTSSASVSYLENRKELTEIFGNKKRKRALQLEEDNAINPSHLLNKKALTSILGKQAENLDKFVHTEHDLDESRLQLLPPFNSAAERPQDIYPTDKLISAEEWDSLKACIPSMKSYLRGKGAALDEAVEEGQLLPFTAQLLRELALDGKKETKNVNRDLKYIALIQILLKFYLLPKTIRTTETELASSLQAPFPIVARIVRDFTENAKDPAKTAIRKSSYTLDKLLIYAMILTLTIHDFSMDFRSLADSLQIPSVRVDMCARETGATKSGTVFKLTTPLTFPKKSRGKAKKKR